MHTRRFIRLQWQAYVWRKKKRDWKKKRELKLLRSLSLSLFTMNIYIFIYMFLLQWMNEWMNAFNEMLFFFWDSIELWWPIHSSSWEFYPSFFRWSMKSNLFWNEDITHRIWALIESVNQSINQSIHPSAREIRIWLVSLIHFFWFKKLSLFLFQFDSNESQKDAQQLALTIFFVKKKVWSAKKNNNFNNLNIRWLTFFFLFDQPKQKKYTHTKRHRCDAIRKIIVYLFIYLSLSNFFGLKSSQDSFFAAPRPAPPFSLSLD